MSGKKGSQIYVTCSLPVRVSRGTCHFISIPPIHTYCPCTPSNSVITSRTNVRSAMKIDTGTISIFLCRSSVSSSSRSMGSTKGDTSRNKALPICTLPFSPMKYRDC
eukprot:Sspe_Gene.44790::Locus_22021_Transcript_1_6_Confidence_0.526_Length_634::g.44790::m.44790